MNKIKSLIKKYFSSFTFFYRHIGNRVFLMVLLSFFVSVLDGFGLTMFLPLLQLVSGENNIEPEQLGKLQFLLQGAENLGVSMNIVSVLMFMIMFFVFKGIASYFKHLYFIILQQDFIKKLRLHFLSSLNKMSFKKFITSDAGQIQNTMSGEVNKVVQAFVTYFATFQQGIMVIVYMVFAFLIDIQFAFMVVMGGVVTNFLYKFIYSRTKDASRELTGADNRYQGLLIQHVTHFKYLRATNMIEKHSEKLIANIHEIERSRKKIGILSGIGIAIREPILVIVVAGVMLIQIYILQGSIGSLLISLLFFYRALTSLLAIQYSWSSFLANAGSLENMQNFQLELETNREKNGTLPFIKFTHNIEFQQVSFSYGDSPILRNINLNIPKNNSIALVGESGSGKTTMVNIITGLLSPNEGHLYIDGNSLINIDKNSYQNRIGYITQEAAIFNDSIYNNITFWAEKNPENIERFEKAIDQAALSHFIKDSPNGADTLLGNNGINLSGGQKQRISIARELYKDIDILIMDEATSALDSETERTIQESIEALQGQYTLIIVAHRLSTIRNVDKVVLMEKGKIIAMDNFNNLTLKNEKFRKMVELQEL